MEGLKVGMPLAHVVRTGLCIAIDAKLRRHVARLEGRFQTVSSGGQEEALMQRRMGHLRVSKGDRKPFVLLERHAGLVGESPVEGRTARPSREGAVEDVAVAVYDNTTGELLAFGYTNEAGVIRFSSLVVSGAVRVSIPYLQFNQVGTGTSNVFIRVAPFQLPADTS